MPFDEARVEFKKSLFNILTLDQIHLLTFIYLLFIKNFDKIRKKNICTFVFEFKYFYFYIVQEKV